MYTALQPNTWKTSLFYCDCESCFISYIAPCHVYAKLRNGHYAYHCFMYAILWVSLQLIYSFMVFVQVNECPANEVNFCFGLSQQNCSQSYMRINNEPFPCSYHTDADVCIYNTQDCITYKKYEHTQTFLWMFSVISYLSIWLLHLKLRNQIKEQEKIYEDPCACLATTCCSTCGLAQVYREV
jgi:hypothetical protein